MIESNILQTVNQGPRAFWREGPLETDTVIDGGYGGWLIEVKTGSLTLQDLKGPLEFCRRYFQVSPLRSSPAPDDEDMAGRHQLLAVNWKDFLLSGPPAAGNLILENRSVSGWRCLSLNFFARCKSFDGMCKTLHIIFGVRQ